jgi:hypothetical protein
VRDAALLALGLGSLGLAGALAASAGPPARADLPASLGAARTLLVDALFLRAEALRERGRVDEVPGLYRRILDLDPGNEAAVDFLADVLARDLRASAPTPDARVRWWLAARDLVEAGLARRPDSARLHFRAGDLWTALPAADPAVREHVAASGVDGDAEGLAHLERAARLEGSMRQWGFLHLDALARLAPRMAAERTARGEPGAEEAIAVAERVLALRARELDSFFLDPVEPPLTAYRRLQAAVNLVKGVRRLVSETPPARDAARALLSTYERHVADDPVVQALRPYVR